MGVRLWQCVLYDDLTDHAYADDRVYRTREDAEKRARRMTYEDDCVRYWARVREVEGCWGDGGRPFDATYRGVPIDVLAIMYDYLANRDGAIGSEWADGFLEGARYAAAKIEEDLVKETARVMEASLLFGESGVVPVGLGGGDGS